ncbi:TPA: hypothetical protein ACSQRE_000142 [Clostridium perfringens]
MTINRNNATVYMLGNYKFVYFSKQQKIKVYDECIHKTLDTITLPKLITYEEFKSVANMWRKLNRAG